MHRKFSPEFAKVEGILRPRPMGSILSREPSSVGEKRVAVLNIADLGVSTKNYGDLAVYHRRKWC